MTKYLSPLELPVLDFDNTVDHLSKPIFILAALADFYIEVKPSIWNAILEHYPKSDPLIRQAAYFVLCLRILKFLSVAKIEPDGAIDIYVHMPIPKFTLIQPNQSKYHVSILDCLYKTLITSSWRKLVDYPHGKYCLYSSACAYHVVDQFGIMQGEITSPRSKDLLNDCLTGVLFNEVLITNSSPLTINNLQALPTTSKG